MFILSNSLDTSTKININQEADITSNESTENELKTSTKTNINRKHKTLSINQLNLL